MRVNGLPIPLNTRRDSSAELLISLLALCKSKEEIHKWKREIDISLSDLCISLFHLPISLVHLCIWRTKYTIRSSVRIQIEWARKSLPARNASAIGRVASVEARSHKRQADKAKPRFR